MKIIGIILAAGKGKRMNSKNTNKTALQFNGKKLIDYGIDLLKYLTSEIVLVVGAYAESVKKSVSDKNVIFARQTKRLGTGHAVKCALRVIKTNPDIVLLGYGDHMMFYSKDLINKLIKIHKEKNAVVSLISTTVYNPTGWGRIIRNTDGFVDRIVEQKDATESEKEVKEVNAGFYCFDFKFLKKNIKKLKKSHITGEYYITDLIHLAKIQNQKVVPVKVPFEYVGIGINTPEQLEESKKLYKKTHVK